MTSGLAAQPSHVGSATFADADDVLHGLPHPAAAVVAFADDTWDFRAVEGLAPNLQRSALVVEWESFANPTFRLAAKEVLFSQLHPEHHRVTELLGWRRPVAVRGIPMHVVLWRAWFAWLDDNDVHDLADVRAHHWDAYLHRRRQDGVSAHHVASTIKRIRDFYDYAAILTSPSYAARPWGRRTARSVAGAKRRRENATPPIPDDVFGPLVGAALHLVEHADTIIAARDVHADVIGPRATLDIAGDGARSPDDCDRRVRMLIDQHQVARCPLPLREARVSATSTEPHFGMIALWAGVSPKVVVAPHRRAMIADAATELGVAPAPLVRSFGEAHDHLSAFGQIISSGRIGAAVDLLVTACYIVVALSGMRVEEITAIRRGCIQRVRLRNGEERIRLHGTVYKHQRLGGTPASWVVIEEIERAVAVLERLAPARQDLLFTPETMRAYRRRTPSKQVTVSINHYLQRFSVWLAGGILPPGVQPLPAGTRVTTRQFRRTMARVLAFRPHGVVAGKVHLKHLHIAMSEGYYGNANSSLAAFHADIEAELATARLEAAKERYQAYLDGGGVAGGARKSLTRHFEEIASAMTTFNGTTLEADRHLEKLLADRLGKLHIGTVNDCWFIDPSKALCRKGETEPTEPRPNACVGDGCPNAAVTSVHPSLPGVTRAGRDPSTEPPSLRLRKGEAGPRTTATRDGDRRRGEPSVTGNRQMLREAMSRLLTDNAIHHKGPIPKKDGSINISGWAHEAGLGATVPYRFKDLIAEFQRHLDQLDTKPTNRYEERLTRLESELAAEKTRSSRYRRERDASREEAARFASQVALLDRENEILRAERPDTVRSLRPPRHSS